MSAGVASRVDVVLLVFRPGSSPYFDEACADPAGFIDRRRDALNRLAGQRMVSQLLFPFSRGPWSVVLPDADPVDVLDGLDALYGAEVSSAVGRAIASWPDAVVVWVAVQVSEKGFDCKELRDVADRPGTGL